MPRFVEPVNVFFRREDRHLIAFLADHPDYESVEAMIGWRRGRDPLIRGIITRRDKTQVDHVNDAAAIAEQQRSGMTREIVFSAADFADDTAAGGNPRASLRFTSYRGEEIVLDYVGATRAVADFGGLTDPLGHAGATTLPVMWRDASSIASPETSVTIDGRRFTIPVEIQSAGFVGLNAYYTDGFIIGVIGTVSVDLQTISTPRHLAAGEEWVYASSATDSAGATAAGDEQVRYRIASLDDATVTIEKIERSGGAGSDPGDDRDAPVQAVYRASRDLRVRDVEVMSESEAPARFHIAFDDQDRFAISIDDHAGLVTGSVVAREVAPGLSRLTLVPETPPWALERAVRADVEQSGPSLRCRQTIGEQ